MRGRGGPFPPLRAMTHDVTKPRRGFKRFGRNRGSIQARWRVHLRSRTQPNPICNLVRAYAHAAVSRATPLFFAVHGSRSQL